MIYRFTIGVLLLQTLKAKPQDGFAATRGDRRAPRAARRRRRRLRSMRRETRRGLWRRPLEAVGSRSRGTRQGAAFGMGSWKPQACGAGGETSRGFASRPWEGDGSPPLRRQTAGLPQPRSKTKGAGAAPKARAGRRKTKSVFSS